MKIVIDIPDEDYKFIKEVQLYLSVRRSGKTIERNVINAIKNGTPYEERPHGEWHGNNFDEHSCPLCGHAALYEEEPDGYYEVQSNFCPNCGADMRGDKV